MCGKGEFNEVRGVTGLVYQIKCEQPEHVKVGTGAGALFLPYPDIMKLVMELLYQGYVYEWRHK